jgi:hypothetical protein
MDKDDDNNPSTISNGFSEGLEKGKQAPNMEDHRERLKDAIRAHAKNNRKVVRARKRRPV